MTAEIELFARRSQGSNAVKIPSLGSMPDSDLYELIPSIIPGCEIDLKGGEIWGKIPSKEKLVRLLACEKLSLYGFNLINGQNSLKKMADEFSSFSGLSFERAFAFTRGLFLTLVKAGVCLPTNNPFLG